MKATHHRALSYPSEAVRGFALIESIFAASFIITVVVVLFGAMIDIIQFNKFAQEQMIARFLVQDTIELIVAKQQYNLARASASWYATIGDNTVCQTAYCMMEPTNVLNLYTASLAPCVNDCRLSVDSVLDMYVSYPTGNLLLETPYYRYVTTMYEDFDLNPATVEAITYTVVVEWFQDQGTTSLREVFTLYPL